MEAFADIRPTRLSFFGKSGSEMRGQVVIIPRADLPFEILEVTARSGANIHHRLETFDTEGRRGYRLLVENTRTDPGRYVDNLTLRTDSPLRPRITIPVVANIAPGETGASVQ